MNKIETFQQFLATQSVQTPVTQFVLNLILAIVLAIILDWIYVRYGNSLSNRKGFASNFTLMAATTMIIISIVKSSLALSLGLVGALSIVRFRSAIKEPEELTYLFLTIAIGLGFGANQSFLTIIGFFVIISVILLKNHFRRFKDDYNMYITVSSPSQPEVNLKQIVTVLEAHCAKVNIRRFDENHKRFEALFMVEFSSFSEMEQSKNKLMNLSDTIQIAYLDNDRVSV